MARRPWSRKYRNLTRGANDEWRFQMVDPTTKKRVRIRLGTRDADEAVRMRDELLSGTGGFLPPPRNARVRFAEMAERYLDYDPRSKALATTTRHDRELLLRRGGRILNFFGDYGLDEITSELLERYWTEEVIEAKPKPRKPNTGKQDVAAIAAVLRYARKMKKLKGDPCADFAIEMADCGTKASRANVDPERDIRPIDVGAIPMLLCEAEKESLRDLVCVLLLLDAGLRSGEALGLRWRHIEWGNDDARNSRKLYIEENRPRGGVPEAPKSGRRRTVGMSKRLRAALLRYQREGWNPSPEEHVLKGIDADNWSKREWRRITKRAGIVARRKDLRDTFASVLLSNGTPLKYVSRQLGHSKTATTEKYYAKWIHEDDYVDPVRLSPSELPADVLTRSNDPEMTRQGLEQPRKAAGAMR